MVRTSLSFQNCHVLTLPELCWWAIRCDVVAALPEGMARKSLRMPDEVIQSVTRESDIVPAVQATGIVLAKAQSVDTAFGDHESQQVQEKPVLKLAVDPESPESFMLRPKRRRWENQAYTRWVKTQPCAACCRPADDPHHVIGHGMGGTGTKSHDLFVIPLCRSCHNSLHADVAAFEQKNGTQLELLFRFIDRVLAIGVIATATKNSGDKNA